MSLGTPIQNSVFMKKIFFSVVIFFLTISSSFAQTSFFGGLNAVNSTNKGFFGLNPTLEIEQNIFGNLNADFRFNVFFDLGPNENIPGVDTKDYHQSIYSDLGLNFKLIDRKVDWSIGGGGSYRIGAEKYVSGAGWTGDRLDFYETKRTNFSGFGIFVESTIGFGEKVSLNLTVYKFNFWGEYMSIGPSFKIN
jgi:hypothetical protein